MDSSSNKMRTKECGTEQTEEKARQMAIVNLVVNLAKAGHMYAAYRAVDRFGLTTDEILSSCKPEIRKMVTDLVVNEGDIASATGVVAFFKDVNNLEKKTRKDITLEDFTCELAPEEKDLGITTKDIEAFRPKLMAGLQELYKNSNKKDVKDAKKYAEAASTTVWAFDIPQDDVNKMTKSE